MNHFYDRSHYFLNQGFFRDSYPFHLIGALAFMFLATLIVWTLIWKGIALWKAARNGSKGWFVALLLINTLGILEILYIFIFSKKNSGQK